MSEPIGDEHVSQFNKYMIPLVKIMMRRQKSRPEFFERLKEGLEEAIKMSKLIIGVDFDGTLVRHRFPEIGEEVTLAVDVCLELQENHKLILYTMRSNESLEAATKWCEDRGIKLWGINKNPSQSSWTNSPKVYAHIYIDDAAYGCPLVYVEGERPYVDWSKVLEYINSFEQKKTH